MTEPVGRSATTPAATTPAATTAPPELSPRLLQALTSSGLDPAQFQGAWSRFGLSPGLLPGLLTMQGSSIEEVATQLAAHGVTADDVPAVATFLGVPANQQAEFGQLLHLPAATGPGTVPAGGTTPAVPAEVPVPAKADAVALSVPNPKAGKASPIQSLLGSPEIKKMITDQVFDRDPAAIKADRKGMTPEIGISLAQFANHQNAGGFHVALAPQIGRLRLSGNDAAQWAMTLDAPIGAGLMVGPRTGFAQADVSLRAGFGRVLAGHSHFLGRTAETTLGVYALGGAVATAGVVSGSGNLAVGWRAGGGLNLGPLFVEVSRAYTTAGVMDQGTAGVRLTF